MHDSTSAGITRPFETKEFTDTSNKDSMLRKEIQTDNQIVKNSLLESDVSTLSEFYRPLYVKRLKSTPKGKKKK